MARKKSAEAAPPDDELDTDDSVESPVAEETQSSAAPVESEVEEQPQPFHTRLGGEFAELDEDTAAQRIQDRLKAHEEAQRREAWYQQRLAQMEQAQYQAQHQAQQRQQQEQAQSQSRKYKDWKAPEFHSDWLSMVERDEKGNLVPRVGADPSLPQKIAAFDSHRVQMINRLAQDPDGFIAERLFESPLIERFEKIVAERLQEQEQKRNAFVRDEQVVQWEQQYQKVLYDQNGQVTNTGRRIINYANELGGRNGGVWALDKAMRIVYGEMLHESNQQPQAPAQDKNKQFLRNAATGKRNRSGALQRPETASAPNLSAHDRLRAHFAANGFDDNHVFAN